MRHSANCHVVIHSHEFVSPNKNNISLKKIKVKTMLELLNMLKDFRTANKAENIQDSLFLFLIFVLRCGYLFFRVSLEFHFMCNFLFQ